MLQFVSRTAFVVFLLSVILEGMPCVHAAGGATPSPAPSTTVSRTGHFYRYAVKPNGLPAQAAFIRSVPGRFNDDPRFDVAVLRDTAPLLFVNPAVWDSALRVPVSATDIARYPATATHGGDELLTVGPDGLRAWTRRSDTDSYDVRALGRDPLWSDATLLRVCDLDAQFGPDLLAMRADGSSVLVMRANETGFDTESAISLAAPATDLTAANLGPGGGRIIAACGPDGLRVWRGGAETFTYQGASNGFLTTVGNGPGGGQAVVWIAEGSAGNHEMYLIGEAILAGPVSLGPIAVASVDAGDLDLDGDDDLLVSRADGNALAVFENRDGVFSPDRTLRLWSAPSEPFTPSIVNPTLVDLDGDRDLDVFFPIQAAEEIVVIRNSRRNGWMESPRLAGPVLFNLLPASEGSPHDKGILQLRLRDAPVVPPTATHIEVIIWRKPDLATATLATPAPAHLFRFEVGGRYRTGPILLANPEPSVFFWTQQYVRLDEAGVRTDMFPPTNFAFTVDWDVDGDILRWLVEQNSGSVFNTTVPDPALQTGPPQTETLSTIVKIDPLIDYDDDEEPDDDFDF